MERAAPIRTITATARNPRTRARGSKVVVRTDPNLRAPEFTYEEKMRRMADFK
jgi:hypothetical protein